jgi:hypothetical protein
LTRQRWPTCAAATISGGYPSLVTPKFLNRRIRRRVLDAAEVAYAQG